MSQYEVATLKKGLKILELLQQADGMTLSEIMRTFDLNKSTTFRLLYTLEVMGYVIKEDHMYRATEKAGRQVLPINPRLEWVSVPLLHQLSRDIGETTCIGIIYGTTMVTTQVFETEGADELYAQVGDQIPVHGSAFGKTLLAFLCKCKQEQIMRKLTLQQNTGNTFVDLHLLREHLKVIRRQGYAVDNEEMKLGLRCIAAPIFYKGEAIAAAALTGPAARLTKQKDRAFAKKLVACCTLISNRLE